MRIAHWLIGVVMAAAVGGALVLGVGPHLLGYRPLSMLSGSMAPGYPTGSELIDTRIPTADLRIGDVVTYHIPVYDHHLETHRVVALSRAADGGWVMRTKGDHNAAADPWTSHIVDTHVWVARADIPWLGAILTTLRSVISSPALRLLACAAALAWLLWGLWRVESTVAHQ